MTVLIRADVHVVDENLAALDAAERLLEVRLAGAKRLDLGAGQHKTGLEGLVYEIIVIGLLVGRDDLNGHAASVLR